MSAVFPMDNLKVFFESNLKNSVVFAFLVGSAGTDRFTEHSDVDIALFWAMEPSLEDQQILQSKLEELLERDVDLINLNQSDYIFARQVLETGRLIINNSPEKLLRWKTRCLSLYPDFKFSRQQIEKNILKRKKYV